MEIIIDKFGRVLLPKTVRTHFGLKAGSKLEIEEHNHHIELTPVSDKPQLLKKGQVLVFMGEAVGDIESFIEESRISRDKEILGS